MRFLESIYPSFYNFYFIPFVWQTHLEASITRHKLHIKKLELILRLLDNDELSPEQVNDVKDFLDDYVERNQVCVYVCVFITLIVRGIMRCLSGFSHVNLYIFISFQYSWWDSVFICFVLCHLNYQFVCCLLCRKILMILVMLMSCTTHYH
jgi:hypothetical protein